MALMFIENTNFKFRRTNFAGDPKKSAYGSDARTFTVIIPETEVEYLRSQDVDVKEGTDRDGNPEYFLNLTLKYRDRYGEMLQWPPKVYLYSTDGQSCIKETEETIGELDDKLVSKVNITLNISSKLNPNGKRGVYVRNMEVFLRDGVQQVDPIEARHKA